MLQGCVIGAGVIAANVPGIVAFAQAQPKLRRSLLGMPLNDPIISAWRDAVRMLKEPTRPTPINWTSLANIHGTASGFNSAIARTGGLIATALAGAVIAQSGPALVGAFQGAALVGAGLAVAAGLTAFATLPEKLNPGTT